jgi:hypothetical protein
MTHVFDEFFDLSPFWFLTRLFHFCGRVAWHCACRGLGRSRFSDLPFYAALVLRPLI